jgi:hypothetical protein
VEQIISADKEDAKTADASAAPRTGSNPAGREYHLGLWGGYHYHANAFATADVQLAKFFSLGLEMGIGGYKGKEFRTSSYYNGSYWVPYSYFREKTSPLFTTTLFAKLPLRPGNSPLEIDLMAGPALIVGGLPGYSDGFHVGLLAGMDLGWRLGPGVLYLAARLEPFSTVQDSKDLSYLAFGGGYKMVLPFKKKEKAK